MKVFVALLHYPMLDRQGREITTAVTNLDIHDIARSCRTFGVERYFVVHPDPEQRKILARILGHWGKDQSREYHPKRAEALAAVEATESWEATLEAATRYNGGVRPTVAMPDARAYPNTIGYRELRGRLREGQTPGILLVFGTGWGMAPRFFDQMDLILAPIEGPTPYNHLSVRSACAIVLDRLLSP
jgi:hypothetical protein